MSLLFEFESDFSDGIFGTDDDSLSIEITYTPSDLPADGDPLEIQGIFNRAEDLDDANWQAALQASAVLYVRVSDVAEPSYQDQVDVDGETWTVARKLGKSGGLWKLGMLRDLRPTFRR